MAQQPAPVDETVFSMPDVIHWHMAQNGGQPMDENMIHRYVATSPFFDHTSKNGLTIDQARTNLRAFQISNNRKPFEDDLKRKKGLEYMIVGDPQPLPGGPKVEAGIGGNGMWVVRKQDRDRVQATDGSGRWEEELKVLGTYYLIGENMYQAPSVGDVVGNRLTAAANNLSKFFDTARNLPTFEADRGYSYIPYATSTQKPTSTSASATGTPSRSREGSIVPGAGADTQSLRSTSLLPETNTLSSQGCSFQDTRLIVDSFNRTYQYGDDFMDENTLAGEPGSFTFPHSTQAIKKRRADADAIEAAALAAAKARESQANSKVATPALKVQTPPAVMTEKAVRDVREREKDRRGSKIEKMKRKKSRHSIAPGTPASATSATASSAPNSAI